MEPSRSACRLRSTPSPKSDITLGRWSAEPPPINDTAAKVSPYLLVEPAPCESLGGFPLKPAGYGRQTQRPTKFNLGVIFYWRKYPAITPTGPAIVPTSSSAQYLVRRRRKPSRITNAEIKTERTSLVDRDANEIGTLAQRPPCRSTARSYLSPY